MQSEDESCWVACAFVVLCTHKPKIADTEVRTEFRSLVYSLVVVSAVVSLALDRQTVSVEICNPALASLTYGRSAACGRVWRTCSHESSCSLLDIEKLRYPRLKKARGGYEWDGDEDRSNEMGEKKRGL